MTPNVTSRYWRKWNSSTFVFIALGVPIILVSVGCVVRTLAITSDPTNAHVTVNGELIGRTPIEHRLVWAAEEQVHTVEVSLDEYDRVPLSLSQPAAKRAPKQWPHHFTLARLNHLLSIRIETSPPGAAVHVDGVSAGAAPTVAKVRYTRMNRWAAWNMAALRATLQDHFPATYELAYQEAITHADAAARPLRIELQPATVTHNVTFDSTPAGAMISVDGKRIGPSPITVPVRFTRASPSAPWSQAVVHGEISDYLPVRVGLTLEQASTGTVTLPPLVRVRHALPVNIMCNQPSAEVRVNGTVVGHTNLALTFPFERSDGNSPWRSFLVEIGKQGFRWKRPPELLQPGDTSSFSTALTYEQALGGELRVELEPISFILTKLRYLKFDPDGLGVVEELVLAQIGEVETEPMVRSVTRMSDYAPGELTKTRLWVAAPDQQLVYSVPAKRAGKDGAHFNLWKQVGRGLTRLTDGPVTDYDACVSMDGEYAYFAANRLRPDKLNLWRARMTGQGGFTKITDSPSSVYDLHPSVAPNGTRVAFQSLLHGTNEWQIWVANADGTLPTQLRLGEAPAWSPDGGKIAYVALDDNRCYQIWVMNADGSNPTQLTTGNAKHEDPLWTPDGTRIVYVSYEAYNAEGTRNADIWIMNADGTDRTQLTVNGSHDIKPAISPDGKYIYFLSNRGPKSFEPGLEWLQVWRIELK